MNDDFTVAPELTPASIAPSSIFTHNTQPYINPVRHDRASYTHFHPVSGYSPQPKSSPQVTQQHY